jgi:hypothetical protein
MNLNFTKLEGSMRSVFSCKVIPTYLRLCAHGNVFERSHLCFHAKTDAKCKHYEFTTEVVVYLIYWRPLDRVNRASKRLKGQKCFCPGKR